MKIEKYLISGETVRYIAKPSKAPVIVPLIITAVLLCAGLPMANSNHPTAMPIGLVISIIGFVFALFTIGQLENIVGTWVIVTDKRVMMHRGMLKNIFSEVPIDKVSGITINQSLFGRLFDYSTIIVESSAIISGVKTPFISKPFDFKRAIQENAVQSN